jgi:hypothetical protein
VKSKELTSCLPRSPLPTASNGLIPNHQFSFRQRNSTTEQTHRIAQINEALENKQYCSAAYLDISQTFNKV